MDTTSYQNKLEICILNYCDNTSEGRKKQAGKLHVQLIHINILTHLTNVLQTSIIRSFSASTSELVRGLSRYETRTSVYISHVQGVSLSGHDYHDPLVG